MRKVARIRDLRERLEKLTHELVQIKAALVYEKRQDKPRAMRAWQDLMKASEEVSASWSGYTALEEIRAQRER